ncbi:hypothetical protein MMC19_003797 [Ptychographa xylographoides]|nr:hypothetical protein [Ptychographa xylographoides]
MVALLRYFISDSEDPYKCGALMNRGRWLDPPDNTAHQKFYNNWQPPGCILHQYTGKDILACFEASSFVLVGDSTMRQIFWAIARKLDVDTARRQEYNTSSKHQDITFQNESNVSLRFVWDPYLNSTALVNEVTHYSQKVQQLGKQDLEENPSAGILIGGGLWHSCYLTNSSFQYRFEESISRVLAPLPSYNTQDNDDHLLLAPVLSPSYDLLSVAHTTITAEKVDTMNDYLHHVASRNGADILWSLSLMIEAQKLAHDSGGLHVVNSISDQQADVILNLKSDMLD